MKINPPYPLKLSPKAAIAVQRQLSNKIVNKNQIGPVRYIAGADVALDKESSQGYAAVIILAFPALTVEEQVEAVGTLEFPYIPGLLAFREIPVLLKAFAKLKLRPDLVLIDGQGLAHPRRFGIACHMGLLLDRPTIGCAKSRLIGRHAEPGRRKGSCKDLLDSNDDVIGAVVRTRTGTRPLYISIGHKMDLAAAVRYTLKCCPKYRIPEPIRLADILVGKLKRSS